jgi:uncharacterized RDD family membrane protein YckC
LFSLGLLILLVLELAAPAQPAANPASASGPEDLIRILTDLKLSAGEEVNDAVVLFGRGTTEGTVHRNFFSLGSDVEINGPVNRDLTILFGKVKLGPKAEVGGHAAFIGCEVERSPEAKFKRTPKELFTAAQFPQLHWATEYLGQGVLRLRPLPPGVPWVWAVTAMLALVYLLMQMLFPAPVEASVSALRTRPVTALFSGLVVSIVVAPVCVLLVATGVGVLLLPLVLVAFVGALLLGKTAVLRFVGHQLGRQIKLNLLEHAVFALVVGGGLVTLLYMVPVLGAFVWGGLTLLGLGSTVVAGVQHLGKESEAAAPLAPRATVDTANAAGEAALPRVGFWRRFVATLLDAVLIGATAGVLSKGLLLLPAWFLYHLIMWRWKGTTIGGIVFGLKLMREDGRPVTLAVALVRSLASLFSLIALGLGFFWAGWSRDKRAWHDRIAGTIIVQMPRGMSLV